MVLLGLAAALLFASGAVGLQPQTAGAAGYGVEVLETASFFDSHGTYTVVGSIKNHEPHHIVPRITVSVLDGGATVTESFLHMPVAPSGEMPFRVGLAVSGDSPILLAPEVSYVAIQRSPTSIQVIYDGTLIVHDDGHLTGRVINVGNDTMHNVSILAVMHGTDHRVLDAGRSAEPIGSMGPGEILGFSMYPDPAVSEEIFYYSCFAITDSFVKPVYTERNGSKFYFRYESGSWYAYPAFNEAGTELRMRTQNSFPLETYANFEFPVFDEGERFAVFVNGQQKEIIQSVDEWGSWHVAFVVDARESGDILITGFEEGWELGDSILIPDWMRTNALWWSGQEGSDEVFLMGIKFLVDEGIIQGAGSTGDAAVPGWVKWVAALWADGQIDDATFVAGMEYLIGAGAIRV
jgi:hypothetical protein